MTNRIRCINPACRRTAAAEKFPGTEWIICAKCWKALPPRLRARNRQIGRRFRKLNRLNQKPAFQGRDRQWNRVSDLYTHQANAIDTAIEKYFRPGSAEPGSGQHFETPAGVEDFMRENGIG